MSEPRLLERLRSPDKVAVLRASRLGDFVCAMPALRALRLALPDAEISIITLPLLRDVAQRSPYFDRFIAFPGFPGIAQQFFRADVALQFVQRMQHERFDLAIQMQGSGVYANPFTLMLGAVATAGFVRAEDDASCLDAALIWPERGHETHRLLALMRHIGVDARDEQLTFPLLAQDWRAASDLLAGLPRPLIGVHAGSHDARRRWPVERYAAATRRLLRTTGGTAVLLGSLHESPHTLELAAAIGAGAYNIAGRTSLGALGAVIAQLNLLLTNDTGPAHIAYALGTRTVTVYRRGGIERYGPLASGPFAALEPEAVESERDGLVSVAQVLAAAERLLDVSSDAPRSLEMFACPPPDDSKESVG